MFFRVRITDYSYILVREREKSIDFNVKVIYQRIRWVFTDFNSFEISTFNR